MKNKKNCYHEILVQKRVLVVIKLFIIRKTPSYDTVEMCLLHAFSYENPPSINSIQTTIQKVKSLSNKPSSQIINVSHPRRQSIMYLSLNNA